MKIYVLLGHPDKESFNGKIFNAYREAAIEQGHEVWWQYRNSDINTLKRATLEFCGVSPVKVKRIDRLRYKSDKEKDKIIDRIKRIQIRT